LTTHGSDLPAHAQNAVIGRFIGFEALAPYISFIESEGYHGTAIRLRDRLCAFTNDALDNPGNVAATGSFLEKMIDILKAELATFREGPAAASKIVVTELERSVELYNAAPFDPLRRLTEAVAITAADYYRSFGARVPEQLWESTYANFSFVGGRVGLSFWRDIHVQLWTEFGRYDNPTAQVFVRISPRWLDQETIAALPRALLHEYVTHVPQGPYPGQRAHPDPADQFAEGWMDYIAHRIHKAVLERYGPSGALSGVLAETWTTLYESAAAHFHVTRCSLDDADWTSAARLEGWTAARQMHDLLRRLPQTTRKADELLYQLSFDLNISELDNVSRARFAARVRLCLRRASHADVLVAPLRDWAAGHTRSQDLFKRVIGL
jgi:hypothetical protein